MADIQTRSFSIGVLVRRFNVSAESLRNWERAGLIPPAYRTPGGHRRYGQAHVQAVHNLLYAPAVSLDHDQQMSRELVPVSAGRDER